MQRFLDRTFVTVACPRCAYPLDVQLLDVRIQARVFCPNCKVEVRLADDGASTEVATRKIDAALEQLTEAFKI
jgi:uncharacterized Zn finger protein (UPF0148 family)